MKFASSIPARHFWCASALMGALTPSMGHAATLTYGNPAGAQNFTVGANWVGGVAPGSGDFPLINGTDGTVDYPYVDAAVAVQRFNVADLAASSAGLEIRSGGSLTTSLTSAHYVGTRGTGLMTIQNGATVNVNGPLNIGWGDAVAHGAGTVNQLGGAYNGTSSSAGLILGTLAASTPLPASSGTYNLQEGSLALGGSIVVGQAGVGVFNMSGGIATTNSFLQIGRTGTGTFTQTGGAVTANRASGDAMVIAALAGATGTYEISGGSLSVIATGAAGLSNGILAGTANGTLRVIGNGATSISIVGDYKQYEDANLDLEIGAGITPIELTGNVTLGGALDVAFTASPSLGQQFTVLNYGGSLTGAFSTFDNFVDGPLGPNTIELSISYGAGSDSAVVLTVVPEPASASLIVGGVALASLAARQRWNG
jgi:T5SS/PEP-CTERM-associated repeat protein